MGVVILHDMKLMIFIIAAILLCLPAWAGTWSDNFNDGNLDSWQTFEENRGLEKWTVENGEASAESFGTFAILYTGEADWKDYTVECKANFKNRERTGFHTMGVWVRLREHSGYYMALAMSWGAPAGYAIFKHFEGLFRAMRSIDLLRGDKLGELSMPELNSWYRLKAKVERNKLSFYVNGMLALEVEDKDNPIESGKVGLCVQGTSVHAHFDDVKITGVDIPDTQAVDPNPSSLQFGGK
jgi:hypothetical protein